MRGENERKKERKERKSCRGELLHVSDKKRGE
jgi:hypothetical protein